MNNEFMYEVTYKFKDKHEYNEFIEAQAKYAGLRRLIYEWEEMCLRKWTKYGTFDALRENREAAEYIRDVWYLLKDQFCGEEE